jgi:PEP-CTERM motif
MIRRVVHRLAMLTTIVAATGCLFTPCQAGILLNTPSGLTPGATFRFVFETDGGTTAVSSNITDYDNFVNAQAAGATYAGQTVSWLAIGSTPSMDAITHIGVNPSISGVYLVTGQRVATSDGTATGGLWSGTLSNAIDVEIHSIALPSLFVWTGTHSDGTTSPSQQLGANAPIFGYNQVPAGGIWTDFGQNPSLSNYSMYSISGVLTVPGSSAVPEPSSGLLAVIGISTGLGLAWTRRCKGQRRQEPVGPSGVIQ